jgi:RNA polymerase sigma-70 factor (ECF subfamily)
MTPASQSSQTSSGTVFKRVFGSEHAYVLRVLHRLGAREADAEDIAHDVFVIFLRRIRDYDRKRPIRPWLRAIASRVAANHRALARHRVEQLGDDAMCAAKGTTDADEWVMAFDSMKALDEERRAILVLHDVWGYSMPEIAERLGIPLNTGYTRLRLARKSLRECE